MNKKLSPPGYMVSPVYMGCPGPATGEWALITPNVWRGPDVPLYPTRALALKVAWVLYLGLVRPS